MENINTMLTTWNKWDRFGTVEVLTGENRDNAGLSEEILDEDVIVFYDWCDDEMSDTESRKFYDWTENSFSELADEMLKLGYRQIDDNDGSGGGLIYGAILFRKNS